MSKNLMKTIMALCMGAFCLTGNAFAVNYYVNASAATVGTGTIGDPFKEIKSATAIASAATTDVIFVVGGTYNNEDDLGLPTVSNLTVSGSWNSAFTTTSLTSTPTIIEGGNLRRGFVIEGADVNVLIENIIMQNCSNANPFDQDAGDGGAMFIRNTSSVTLRNVHFIDCKAVAEQKSTGIVNRSGGAFTIRDNSQIFLEDCLFDGCTAIFMSGAGANNRGGAFYTRSAGAGNTVIADRCTFINCSTPAGGGGEVLMVDTVTDTCTLRNSIFANNGSGTVPCFDLLGRNVNFLNCTFVGNMGAVSLIRHRTTSGAPVHNFTNNIFANNTFNTDLFQYDASWQTIGTITNVTNMFDFNTSVPLNLNHTPMIGTTGNIAGSSNFVDQFGGDYRLAAGSDAIDAGTTLATVVDDFLGVARPVGTAYDIGAYEGAVTVSSPGSGGLTTRAKFWNLY